jgi:hypothetical protein
MKPLTATRSMRFVVARYSVLNIVAFSSVVGVLLSASSSFEGSPSGLTMEKSRCTNGESSASTRMARNATVARRCVGSGMSMVLCCVSGASL